LKNKEVHLYIKIAGPVR